MTNLALRNLLAQASADSEVWFMDSQGALLTFSTADVDLNLEDNGSWTIRGINIRFEEAIEEETTA